MKALIAIFLTLFALVLALLVSENHDDAMNYLLVLILWRVIYIDLKVGEK